MQELIAIPPAAGLGRDEGEGEVRRGSGDIPATWVQFALRTLFIYSEIPVRGEGEGGD